MAGLTSGGVAAAITSPIELIKTRMQSGSNGGISEIVKGIVKKEGLRGLWKGAIPGVVRSSILTASQCVTYDKTKSLLKTYEWDGLRGHVAASMLAGIVTTTLTNPFDVIKTRMYVKDGKDNILRQVKGLYLERGLLGFLSGWTASYARLGPHTMIMFVCAEYIRKMAGMNEL